jgi:8-oxo-dGTP pyrophosphatase MutT (NUDIX family)
VPDAAAALIIDDANRVLLKREGYEAGRYGLPGGVIEAGETRDAVIREAHEELGLRVEPRELVAVYYLRTDRSEGLRFFFRCEVIDGRPNVPESGEIADFVWAPRDDLPRPLTNTAPHAIADWTEGRAGIYPEIDARTGPT